MSLTISTVPFLILIVVLYFVANRQLFPVFLFTSIFQGAALVIVGGGASGFALAPAQAVLLVLIVQKLTRKLQKSASRPVAQANVTSALLTYGAYALLSAVFCPFFFQGILVSNPRNGMGAPLSWGMYNVTQTVYLLIGITVYWLCVYRSDFQEIKRSIDWYLAGSTFAALLAIYQFTAFNMGLPFPSQLLHSNTQYTIFEAYDMGGFTRVNSTFTEASAAAGCFSVALSLVIWRVLFVECNGKLLLSFISLLTALILTRSSAGYLGLAFIGAATAILYLRKTIVTHRVQLFRSSLALIVLVVGITAFMLPEVRANVLSLLDTVLFTKTQTSSYAERTAWNEAALRAASETSWVGAGWGSLRASSLVANILGTVGIPGLFLFCAFCTLSIRFASKAPADSGQIQRSVILPILVSLIDCVLAGPEMTDPVIWFLFGVAAYFNLPKALDVSSRPPRLFPPKTFERSLAYRSS